MFHSEEQDRNFIMYLIHFKCCLQFAAQAVSIGLLQVLCWAWQAAVLVFIAPLTAAGFCLLVKVHERLHPGAGSK